LKPPSSWYVYLIECRDGSLYTGIAVDVVLRYEKHVAGKGARYTRSHPPLRLLGQCAYPDRAEASRAEYRIKQLSAAQKRQLGKSWGREAIKEAEAEQSDAVGV
jgi:putative endonuclease